MPDHFPDPDAIADAVLTTFASLPPKFKPRTYDDGRREWVPLAGIVLSRDGPDELKCVALATGMKCLPTEKVKTAQGNVLHDSHAEVLAMRAFGSWVLGECRALVGESGSGCGQEEGGWVRRTTPGASFATTRDGAEASYEDVKGSQYAAGDGDKSYQRPFRLDEGVRIHMYCSQAPCGDASMELTMAAQPDATPWSASAAAATAATVPSDTTLPAQDGASGSMLGRGHFDQLGIVRRKPSRPDAPPTLSKSCSDKLAIKQVTGLLSGVTSLLVQPCYLSTLVLPGSQCVREAVSRAWGAEGRMRDAIGVAECADGEFGYRRFEVKPTMRTFEYSRDETTSHRGMVAPPVPSNLSALYTPRKQEVLINGVLQGRKQGDSRGASCVSKRRMWETASEVAVAVGVPALVAVVGKKDYAALKGGAALAGRSRVKREVRERALKGWVRNVGDEGWGLG